MGYKDESELKPNDFFIHLHKLILELKDDEKFNIISTGSQTNTAQYLLAYPEDAKKINKKLLFDVKIPNLILNMQ